MQINKNFMHQVGDQPKLYYDARSTNHQDLFSYRKRGVKTTVHCK
jgi:hypothetical protein